MGGKENLGRVASVQDHKQRSDCSMPSSDNAFYTVIATRKLVTRHDPIAHSRSHSSPLSPTVSLHTDTVHERLVGCALLCLVCN